MPNGKSYLRGGFTLVELLVSIAIIGMLMALTSVAVWNTIKTAKQAKISVEMDHLAQAVQAYKENQIQFPPCMGLKDLNSRRIGFMRHVQLAFPNSAYGTKVENFTNPGASKADDYGLRESIMKSWGYNYLDEDNAIKQLDLNMLDQAEALVFWLGGFPTPVNASKTPVSTRRLFGFHRDSDNPFKRDSLAFETPDAADPVGALRYRTEPLFGFDQTRLIDNDRDGWLEYVPLAPKSGVSTAPYVYFDNTTYNASVNRVPENIRHFGYPRFNDGTTAASDKAAALFSVWGMAAPMAAFFDNEKDPPQPTQWAKPNGFQIICAGLDGEYTGRRPDFATSQRIPVFPSGFIFEESGGYTAKTAYSTAEYDNITNLSSSTLETARGQSQQ